MNKLTVSPLKQVDDLIKSALEHDNIDIILAEINKMVQAKELVGKVLAKTIYLLHQSWYSFSISEHQTFIGTLESVNVHYGTIQRYLKYEQEKRKLPENFRDKPIRELLPITNALAQGYNIDEDGFASLDKASNLADTYRIIREIKNEEPRKSSLQIYLKDDGSIFCWHNQERYDVGFLDVHSEHEAVRMAITSIVGERIIRK